MIKNLKKELKVAGFKIQVKQTDQTCPKHPKVNLIVTDKSDEPFCPQCQLEKMEQKKKKLVDDFKIKSAKGVLRHDSLIDLPSDYNCTFDTFKASDGTKEAQIKHRTKVIAYELMKDRKKPMHVIFYGTPGEGKTHLAMSILNAVNEHADPPQSCLFVDVNELFNRIRDSFNNPNQLWSKEYAINKLKGVDLLVIDDLGSESAMKLDGSEANNFIQETLKKVLEQQRCIITTNLTSRQLKQVYNPKIVSRLFANSRGYAIDFSGIKDKRY